MKTEKPQSVIWMPSAKAKHLDVWNLKFKKHLLRYHYDYYSAFVYFNPRVISTYLKSWKQSKIVPFFFFFLDFESDILEQRPMEGKDVPSKR